MAPNNPGHVFSVSEITQAIRRTLEPAFPSIVLEGEISNWRVYSSGHAYFTLKDEHSQISAVMFEGNLRGLTFLPKDGLKVQVRGSITVFEQRGNYQIKVLAMNRVGAGDLMAKFEELKRRLNAEGLFARKRPLPLLPRTVGVVTSPSGAVIHDILNVTRRRFPNIHIILAPVRVQGEGAAQEIAEAIALFNKLPAPYHPDVLIVGRGGGSMEDLWCFNDERVARAVYGSELPVISSVGHETDFTICDFVADVRAPTPSAAAELVVGRKDQFEASLAESLNEMTRYVAFALKTARARLDGLVHHEVFARPQSLVEAHAQHLDQLGFRMTSALRNAVAAARRDLAGTPPRLERPLRDRLSAATLRLQSAGAALSHAWSLRDQGATARLDALGARLEALGPLSVLRRGYSITLDAKGRVIRSAADVRPGDTVRTRLADGSFSATVNGSAGRQKAKPKPPPRQLELF